MAAHARATHLKEYSFAETKRHKPCLIYHGHRYVQDKIQNRTIYWRCEDRSRCNGRAHQLIGNGSLPILTIKHNHPPILEDLSKHDIISVDSHRRRKRESQKVSLRLLQQNADDHLSTSTSIRMNLSSAKFEKQNKQQQQTAMAKNLHTSEVITSSFGQNMPHYNQRNTYHHSNVDQNEMARLLNNIATPSTTTMTKSSVKTSSTSPAIDYPSRLNHFSWEEIEGRYLPVIYRYENGRNHRYISKTYVEHTLFESESWKRHALLARSLRPLVSHSYTEHELRLYRFIIEWHLASVHFKTIPSTDCLICFEDLLDFYSNLRKLRDNFSIGTFNRPTAPLPQPSPITVKPTLPSQSFEVPTQVKSTLKPQSNAHLLPQTADVLSSINRSPLQPPAQQQQRSSMSHEKCTRESGWVQINNVFVPYVVKVKIREHELNKFPTRQATPQLQREYYVPYEILIKCHIFSDHDFVLRKLLIKATPTDFDMLNNLITSINIFDEKVPEKTLLVNLYHIMIGLNRTLYVKFLPMKQPRAQVNKHHAEILAHKGGTMILNGNKLIPYIMQNNHLYVPLLYTFHSMPQILLQAKRGARVPRQHEIDYLNLLLTYFTVDAQSLTSDTLLVDINSVKNFNALSFTHFRTLQEHQEYEKNRLLNSIMRCSQTSKPTSGSMPMTTKTNKYPVANVVVNPMIHHPSFYGFSTSKPTPSAQKQLKQPDIKTLSYNNRTLTAIVRTPDTPVLDWKISMKEIFQKFSFNIDYERFIRWCQINVLLPLTKLDDDECRILRISNNSNDVFVYRRNLDRCIELLNDLSRDSISMTLSPTSTSNQESLLLPFPSQSQSAAKSPLSGAKKRKTAMPTTRHVSPVRANEAGLQPVSTPSTMEKPLTPTEDVQPVNNDIPVQSLNNQTILPTTINENNSIAANDDDDDDQMPVVAYVEENQAIMESNPADFDRSFIIVDSTDCNDEKIQLDNGTPSCSSGYESSTGLANIDLHMQQDDEATSSTTRSRKQSPSESLTASCRSPTILLTAPTKSNKQHHRNKYGRSRARSRSLTPRCSKRLHTTDDESFELTTITKDKIEQHLKTLFKSAKRTRTRPIKTPIRLVEQMDPNNQQNYNNESSANEPQSETNVFDIISTSKTTDATNTDKSSENQNQMCTYNVTITDSPNKLGLTIKKIVQP